MEQSHFIEAKSDSANQEIPRFLWNPKVQCCVILSNATWFRILEKFSLWRHWNEVHAMMNQNNG